MATEKSGGGRLLPAARITLSAFLAALGGFVILTRRPESQDLRLLVASVTAVAVVVFVWSVRAHALKPRVKTALTAGSAVLGALLAVVALPADSSDPSSTRPNAEAPRAPSTENSSSTAAAPTFAGTIKATNHASTGTVDQDSDGSISATAGDSVSWTLRLINQGQLPASDVRLRTRVRTTEDVYKQVIEFSVQVGDGPDTVVKGARLVIRLPDSECEPGRPSTGALTMKGNSGSRELTPARSWSDGPLPDGVDVIALYSLPDVGPGQELHLSGPINIQLPSGSPQIEGGPAVKVKVVSGDNKEYTAAIGAKEGDVVRTVIRLHNVSCTSALAKPTVQATPGKFSAARGTLTFSVIAMDASMDPPTTRFTPVTINITDGRPASLQPLRGTTKLYKGGCGDPSLLKALPDWLFQGGVTVEVPGYIPRMKCEEHVRWITTDLRVVAQ